MAIYCLFSVILSEARRERGRFRQEHQLKQPHQGVFRQQGVHRVCLQLQNLKMDFLELLNQATEKQVEKSQIKRKGFSTEV